MSEDAIDIDIETPGEETASSPGEGTDVSDGSEGGSERAEDPREEPSSANWERDAERSLSARVAAHDEDLAAEVESLREHADELEADLEATRQDLDDAEDRIEELESTLKRTRADFENYKKRAKKRQEEIRARATEDLVERLVPVRDNLLRALEQDESVDIRDGVETTLEEFDRVLGEEGVDAIEPEPGDEVDPERHQVMMRVDSDQPAETIAEVYRVGYEMADRVVQEAQVTVSDGDQ